MEDLHGSVSLVVFSVVNGISEESEGQLEVIQGIFHRRSCTGSRGILEISGFCNSEEPLKLIHNRKW